MEKKMMFLGMFFALSILVLIGSCTTQVFVCPDGTTVKDISLCPEIEVEDDVIEEKSCPDSCDDDDACTSDYCNRETDYECVNRDITPCCGNNVCEEEESYILCPIDCEPEIDEEIIEIQEEANAIVGISYTYKYSEYNKDGIVTAQKTIKMWEHGKYMRHTFLSTMRYKENTPDFFMYTAVVFNRETRDAYLLYKNNEEDGRMEAKEVDYNDFYVKTGKEYLIELEEGTFEESGIFYRGRSAVQITSPLPDQKERRFIISEFHSLPIGIEDYDMSDEEDYPEGILLRDTIYDLLIQQTFKTKEIWLPEDVFIV